MWAHSEVGRDANHLWNVSLERIKAKNMLLLYQLWAGNIALRGECYILRSQYVKLLENNFFFFLYFPCPGAWDQIQPRLDRVKNHSHLTSRGRSGVRAGLAVLQQFPACVRTICELPKITVSISALTVPSLTQLCLFILSLWAGFWKLLCTKWRHS